MKTLIRPPRMSSQGVAVGGKAKTDLAEFQAAEPTASLSDEPRAKALYLVFRAIGTNPTVKSFDDRKRMQKQVFLVQKFGVPLGFDYGWYLSGPYSPELTRYYFDIANNRSVYESKTKQVHLSQELHDSVDRFKRALGSNLYDTDVLEALSTILYPQRPSLVEAKKLKPTISAKTWRIVVSKLHALGLKVD